MLVLSRQKDEQVFVGAVQGNEGVPLRENVLKTNSDCARMGYEAQTAGGDPTALLSIHREEVLNDSSPQDSGSSGPNLNEYNYNSNPKGIQETDKSLLNSFISHLGIRGAKSLDKLKSKLSRLQPSKDLENFISYVRNGAFFKHWADHYTKKAQEMASLLGLAA